MRPSRARWKVDRLLLSSNVRLPVRKLFATTLLLGAASACSSEPDPAPTPVVTGCAAEKRADAFQPGLKKVAPSGLVVSLVDASPAPPAKGDNTWTLRLTDATGAPVDGATVTLVPFMPDHGHGSAVKPTVTFTGSDGKYAVSRVYLAMAGYWEITVTVVRGATSDEARFGFCIDG